MTPYRRAQPGLAASGTTPDLKGEALRQLAVVGVSRIGAEIPGPYLQLVCGDLPSRPSLSIVGSSLSREELLADLDILRVLLLETHIKGRSIAAIQGQRANAVFEACGGGLAGFITCKHFLVFNLPRSTGSRVEMPRGQ